MSQKGSVAQKGGLGTNFEQYVQCAFLTTLIIKGNVPCFPSAEIVEVAFQTTNRGYDTDDLLAVAESSVGQHRLIMQVKHNLVFSDSTTNTIFADVIKAFWKDFNNNAIFNKDLDRLIIVKSVLTKDDNDHIKTLFNWAKTHATESDFIYEVNRVKAKKERLDIFRSLLKKANDNKALTDKEIWEFLKCVDLLDYDFLNEGSVDETNFINLIKQTKNDLTILSEKEIWDSIFAYSAKLNKDGGSVTSESIRKSDIFKYFDISKLNPYYKAIKKFESDSEIIFKPIKNTINGFHLRRKGLYSNIINSFNNFPLTIITGNPGTGKSATVKDLFNVNSSAAKVFAFRADQLNEPHLANVLTKQGINESIQDIFSSIALIPEKILIIDSLEKLLEGDPNNAFKQLLSLIIESPDIKIVATSRKYAVDLIIQKFEIDFRILNIIEVEVLNDEELENITNTFPQLIPVLNNKRIKALLRSPKYLDFALSSIKKKSEDYSNISVIDFKAKLWNSVIEDVTTKKKGLSRKRSIAFSNIAIKRAKKMELFIEPDENIDSEAIEALEKDEVIIQERNEYRFSPTHDILEDWALIKYVDSKYNEFSSPKDFFDHLGNEPAIRRAFRLWIEEILVENSDKLNELIKATLLDNILVKYWTDEILIAIFKSDNSSTYFNTFTYELLLNNASFLNRNIHLLLTSCKEFYNNSLPIPIGSGWREIMLFIKNNLTELNILRPSIINLLLSWEYKLISQVSSVDSEIYAVKEIVINYINQIESNDTFWQNDVFRKKGNDLISLVFNLANISKSEITNLVERAFKHKENRGNWELNSFYSSVIEKCLSGINTEILVKELPELVIKTAWKEWKIKAPEDESINKDTFPAYKRYRMRIEDAWGVKDKHTFFPSGVFKTPVYNLLLFHPVQGLDFVLEFINYSVEFYVHSEADYKHEIIEVEIELNAGRIIKQFGAPELWMAYRGSSVTHYALESMLMSLEKYLLELASIKTDISRKNIQYIFNYLLQRSNNVAITGVLASLTIAYPEEVGKEMLPLLSVKEFYMWDLQRSLKDTSPLEPKDIHIPYAQKERYNSNQLPHRTKYTRGLSDFIIDYQFNIGILNKEIHQLFDKLISKSKTDDILWRKTLNEIDIRNHEIGEYDEKLGGIIIQPKYEDDVAEFLNSRKEEHDAINTSMNYSNIIIKAYEGKELLTYNLWEELYIHYSSSANNNMFYDRNVTLSILGLNNFIREMNDAQNIWCVKTIIKTIDSILHDTFTRNYELNLSYNLMEKEIALEAFHIIYNLVDEKEYKDSIISRMINMLIAPFADYEIDKITAYMRDVFFIYYPEAAQKIWVGLLYYAKFWMTNSPNPNEQDKENIITAWNKVDNYIKFISTNNTLTLNIEEISFENYDFQILERVMRITPYSFTNKIFIEFILKLIPLITDDLKIKETYSYNRSGKTKQIDIEERYNIEMYLAELLLRAKFEISKSIIDLLFNSISSAEPAYPNSEKNEQFEFIANILQYLIGKLDNIVANTLDDEKNEQLIKNFWMLWEYLFQVIKNSKKQYFISTLFLDIGWKTEATHWKPLEHKEDIYYKMILEFGINNTKSIIKVFSTIGEKTFLPKGLYWVSDILRKNPSEIINLISPSGERLIKRLFYNHILTIKNDHRLINDYIWILDNMIDLGSSEAYLIRENVITYKRK